LRRFSLYLCLLEDLRTPPKTKLPELLGKNIFDSEHNGDFFSAQHPVVAGRVPRPTIMLSNPPWQEPEGAEAVKTYELWSATRPKPARIPLRQFATAFAYRATDLVQPGGRLCLIMPAGAFVRPQHRKFLEDWLEQVRLTRLINLSDLRLLLFPGSKHPCMVVTAQSNASVDPMGPPHTFDYVTPQGGSWAPVQPPDDPYQRPSAFAAIACLTQPASHSRFVLGFRARVDRDRAALFGRHL
jgi:hypothetical protein